MNLTPSNIAILKRLLVGRSSRPLRSILHKLEPADLASLIKLLKPRELRLFVNALLSLDKAQETLIELPESQLPGIFEQLEPEQIQKLLVYASAEEAAYFLRPFGSKEQGPLLEHIDKKKQQKVLQLLNYAEDTAGRIMQTQFFSLPTSITAGEGLRVLRQRAQTESIYYIYCVDQEEQLVGIISLRQLAIAPENRRLEEFVKEEVISVATDTPTDKVADLVSHYDFVALPVVDSHKKLLGIITVDDVLDVIQEQATAKIYAQAGLQENDRVFTPASESIKKRAPWMLLNLVLAVVASSVVSLFEHTMHELIILASLKNIVAGLGGNTAIQSLTVVTRGLATGDFSFISHGRALFKETFVGVTLGLLTGFSAALLTYFWKGNAMVSVVIFISMVLNSFIASVSGSLVPMALRRLDWDPAVGSGVLVTMITDIFSFFSFLGIATLGLRLVA